MTNREIAQEISNRIGTAPVPFDSVYSIALEIYHELGGEESQFDSVYSILLGILPLTDGIAHIDDSTISSGSTWSSAKIASELADAGFAVEVVEELPTTGDTHTIYFAPSSGSASGNTYDEFMYINGAWEQVGSTAVDLSDYAKKLDYFIPINLQTQEVDWTVLNTTTDGVYRVALGVEMAGQRMITQQGVMTNVLTGNKRTQTIVVTPLSPSAQGSPLQVHYRTTNTAGSQWYEHDYNLGVINDGVLVNPSYATDKVYSRAKVDDLLNNKQDTLIAGEGIEISGNTISATGGGGSSLEAGQNIEIADNKINALGYSFNGYNFAEIPLIRTDAIQEFPYPLEQLGLSDLQLTGDAGATTYTMGGTSAAVMSQMGMQMIQMGVMMKTANSEIAKITSIDTTNSTITFENTLDVNNALSNEVVTKLYVPMVVLISGDAGATTYTYTSEMPLSFDIGDTVSFEDYPLVKVIGKNSSNHTVTFDKTLDESNAVSNAQFKYSLSENNTASAACSHAEGSDTTASGVASHSEGSNTTASGRASHAEGSETTASGEDSHAEGSGTIASGMDSHAEGVITIAQNYGEHAEGRYNTSHKASDIHGNAGNTQHSVGIGTGSSSQYRKNAFEIMQNGDMYVYGVGGYQGTDTNVQEPSIKTLQAYLASLEARINALEGNTTVE